MMPMHSTHKFDLNKDLPHAIWFPGNLGIYRGTPLEMLFELSLELQETAKKTLTLPDVFRIMLQELEHRGIFVNIDDSKDYTEEDLASLLLCTLLVSGIAHPALQA